MGNSQLMRLKFIYFLITLALVIFVARLYQFQIIDKDTIKTQADARIEREIVLPAKRGDIRDRNGVLLAYSLETYNLHVDKTLVTNFDELLTDIVKQYPSASRTDITERYNNAKETDVVIIEEVPYDYVKPLRSIKTEALEIETKMTRVYPNGTLASHVLGLTNKDGKGIEGIEAALDSTLAGKPGYIETRTDELGRKLAYADAREVKAIQGYTVYTTIDRTIQYYAEQAIKTGYQFNEAKRVTAIVQDARTGEILAMANAPDFDPNRPRDLLYESQVLEYAQATNDEERLNVLYKAWRNPAVSDLYEPGSTFKIFTGVVALEEAVVSRYDHFYCNGSEMVMGEKVRCWVYPKSHEDETFEQGFQDSCNVVFMKVMERIDKKAYYSFLKSFGLLDKSSIETGTAKPISRPEKKASVLDLANMSFGHAISVTPIHVMNILQAVSNDGYLIEASLVNKVETQEGQPAPIAGVQSKEVGQVIAQKTAQEMREILTTVITEGSGKKAYIPGYTIAGKTGTAIKSISGTYDDERRVYSSFAAIVPSDKPVFNVLVIVDEPKNEVFGSLVAAPIAREIIYNTLQYLEIPSDTVTGQDVVVVPELVGLTLAKAQATVEELGLILTDVNFVEGSAVDQNAIISKQYPLPGALSSRENAIFVSTQKKE